MVPAAMASHHVGPPDEVGIGAGDVKNEPNHGDDANGLAACSPDKPCEPSRVGDPMAGGGQQILDADVSTGYYPYFVDANAVLRNTVADAPGVEHQDRIYPGTSFMAAWWGWWADKGQGGNLRDQQVNQGNSIPGLADGQADGVINDGHDDHESYGDTRNTGPWDEFVWRGTNPWASQHGNHQSYDDVMYAFIYPGTHDTGPATAPIDNTVGSDSDSARAPDYTMDDRTAQDTPSSPGPLPHNNQGYGWVNNIGWYGNQYDQSFLITTKITTSVNPDPAGQGLYKPLTGDAADVDVYESVHPMAEQAYRTAVWDPGHVDEEESDDNMDLAHENGTKQRAKVEYRETVVPAIETANEAVNQLTAPAGPAQGAVNDATGDKPRAHEPDTGEESYAGGSLATAGDDTYGSIGEEYYTPGSNRDYSGYQQDYNLFMDLKSWMAGAQYNVQLRGYDSYNVYATNTDKGERSQAPSLFWLSTHLGAWYDSSPDNWIGNLDENGRITSGDKPYADGRVEDPNDYGDTPDAHRTSDKDESWAGEFKPASTSSDITATLVPAAEATQDNNGDNKVNIQDRPWGTTSPPAGVYVLEDHDGNLYNPYDDMAEDAVGPGICGVPSVADVNCDEDGQALSQHVQYGPITVEFHQNSQADPGEFFMNENILFPAGTANYEVKIAGTGTLNEVIKDNTGTSLKGNSVTDVDYLVPSNLAN